LKKRSPQALKKPLQASAFFKPQGF